MKFNIFSQNYPIQFFKCSRSSKVLYKRLHFLHKLLCTIFKCTFLTWIFISYLYLNLRSQYVQPCCGSLPHSNFMCLNREYFNLYDFVQLGHIKISFKTGVSLVFLFSKYGTTLDDSCKFSWLAFIFVLFNPETK